MSDEYRDVMKSVKEYTANYKKRLRDMNKKKIEHLVKKYGRMRKNDQLRWVDVDEDVRRMMGTPRMFKDDDEMTVEMVRDPIIVEGENENIVLSEDERELLKLGPKFCLYNKLLEEDFETDVEE